MADCTRRPRNTCNRASSMPRIVAGTIALVAISTVIPAPRSRYQKLWISGPNSFIAQMRADARPICRPDRRLRSTPDRSALRLRRRRRVGRGLDPDLGDLHDFHHCDRRDLRGVLDDRDALVGQWRDHPRDDLRQNYGRVERPAAHAECTPGFELSDADRLQAAAVDLGNIAAVLRAQRQQTG